MRKIILALIVFMIPCVVLSLTKGDVDGNNKVNSSDYILIRNHILKRAELSGERKTRADVNGDGKITSSDYIAIRKILLNKDSSTPIPSIAPESTNTPKPTSTPAASSLVTITATSETCQATLKANFSGTLNSGKAYSWDGGNSWTSKNELVVIKEGTYTVQVKDKNNKIYSGSYEVKGIVPPKLKKGIISSSEFGIVKGTGSNITKEIAIANTDNFNKALQCANNNRHVISSAFNTGGKGGTTDSGIITNTPIHLTVEKGIYYFGVPVKYHTIIKNNEESCVLDSRKNILINFSYVTLDLNGSEFKVYPSTTQWYDLFLISHVKTDTNKDEIVQVTIQNGTLTGDRYEHKCEKGTWQTEKDSYIGCRTLCPLNTCTTRDEQGYGIRVQTNDATIQNMTIKDMMGDGIVVFGDNNFSEDSSKHINIENNEIYECRRNGIAIINGRNITIKKNIIHDINGTSPQVGIDIERDPNKGYTYKNITIEDNKIYNNNRRISIAVFPGIVGGKESLKIINNKLGDQIIFINLGSTKVETGRIKVSGNSKYVKSGVDQCVCDPNKPEITTSTYANSCNACTVGTCRGTIKDGVVKKK